MYPEAEELLFKDLRSAAESGWDFSSRWLKNAKDLSSIRTTQYIPVDLNCLLYHMEKTLANHHTNMISSSRFSKAAADRKRAINKYCWSPKSRWYVDYDLSAKKPSTIGDVTKCFNEVRKIFDHVFD